MGLTKAELDFYTRVPQLFAELVSELKKLNKNLESLKVEAPKVIQRLDGELGIMEC